MESLCQCGMFPHAPGCKSSGIRLDGFTPGEVNALADATAEASRDSLTVVLVLADDPIVDDLLMAADLVCAGIALGRVIGFDFRMAAGLSALLTRTE